MAENEVRNIRITAAEDKRLRAIAPEYLKGGGKIEARVRWAIGEFLQMRDDAREIHRSMTQPLADQK